MKRKGVVNTNTAAAPTFVPRWSLPNGYNCNDEWECFVMVHAALLGAGGVYFTRGNAHQNVWMCERCGEQLGALAAVRHPPDDDYYYWCRCGNHGEDNGDAYHRKQG